MFGELGLGLELGLLLGLLLGSRLGLILFFGDSFSVLLCAQHYSMLIIMVGMAVF